MITIELPPRESRTGFNLVRWAELVADRALAKIEGRIETDRFGRIVMTPTPPVIHGRYLAEVSVLIHDIMKGGRVLTVCPISTADGVKLADVAWASAGCLKGAGDKPCFPLAPEICVEVVLPSDSKEEIQERMALYFDAGAKEVWLCTSNGQMQFFTSTANHQQSQLCPEFPEQLTD